MSIKKQALTNNLIPLSSIAGVDIGSFTYSDPDDFTNPKSFIRQDIVDSIVYALTNGTLIVENMQPVDVVPAEIADLKTDTTLYVLGDGVHRVLALLQYYKDTSPDELDTWGMVKANKLTMNADSVRIHKLYMGLEDLSGKLSDAEIYNYLKDELLVKRMTKEALVDKLKGHARLIDMVKAISGGSKVLEEAVKGGDLTLKEAVKIAESTTVSSQAAAVVDKVENKKKKAESPAPKRRSSGEAKVTMLSRDSVLSLLFAGPWEEYIEGKQANEYELGRVEAFMEVLKLDALTASESMLFLRDEQARLEGND